MTTLTNRQAISAAKLGQKITHTSFELGEWFTIERGMYIFNDGRKMTSGAFWYPRNVPPWFDGYSIFDPKTLQP